VEGQVQGRFFVVAGCRLWRRDGPGASSSKSGVILTNGSFLYAACSLSCIVLTGSDVAAVIDSEASVGSVSCSASLDRLHGVTVSLGK
jgi:hypothetical protein